MKTFEQLTAQEQTAAHERCLAILLEQVTTGVIRFSDQLNGDDLQTRIDRAIAQAEAMQTPWFSHEYILDTCRDDLESMARYSAQDALYAAPDEYVMAGIAA